MHISSTLILIIASTAAALFVGVFVAAAIITHGNRRTIQKYNGNWRNKSRVLSNKDKSLVKLPTHRTDHLIENTKD